MPPPPRSSSASDLPPCLRHLNGPSSSSASRSSSPSSSISSGSTASLPRTAPSSAAIRASNRPCRQNCPDSSPPHSRRDGLCDRLGVRAGHLIPARGVEPSGNILLRLNYPRHTGGGWYPDGLG